jgi:hypothetical protein
MTYQTLRRGQQSIWTSESARSWVPDGRTSGCSTSGRPWTIGQSNYAPGGVAITVRVIRFYPCALGWLTIRSVRPAIKFPGDVSFGLQRESTHYFGGVTDDAIDFDPQAELDYLHRTSADAILANHFFVLAHWAAVHLSTTPADLAGAQLVIDTMTAMLDAGGERLGPNAHLYRSAVAEIQQVFVRAAQANSADPIVGEAAPESEGT